jgi:hypothetical protein
MPKICSSLAQRMRRVSKGRFRCDPKAPSDPMRKPLQQCKPGTLCGYLGHCEERWAIFEWCVCNGRRINIPIPRRHRKQKKGYLSSKEALRALESYKGCEQCCRCILPDTSQCIKNTVSKIVGIKDPAKRNALMRIIARMGISGCEGALGYVECRHFYTRCAFAREPPRRSARLMTRRHGAT